MLRECLGGPDYRLSLAGSQGSEVVRLQHVSYSTIV